MRKLASPHPILFAVAPILTLYAGNMKHFPVGDLLIPLVVAVLAGLLLWWLMTVALHGSQKGGLAAAAFLVLVFAYGPLSNALGASDTAGQFVFIALVIVFMLCLISLSKTRVRLGTLSFAAGVISVSLVLSSSAMIVAHLATAPRFAKMTATDSPDGTSASVSSRDYPNIYYIILDGYARQDVLRKYYHYDNSEMLGFLSSRGFHVCRNSRSNYCQTALSLSSSLNYRYLDDLAKQIGDSTSRTFLAQTINYSRAADFLRRRGYRIVAFQSGYACTEMTAADSYLSASFSPSEFDCHVLTLTPIPRVLGYLSQLARGTNALESSEISRRRIKFTVDRLPGAARGAAPTFVFAHIVAPHPPFVFGADGGPADGCNYGLRDGSHFLQAGGTTKEYVRLYRDQLTFVNAQLKRVLPRILSTAKRPTIIILQSDHGPGSRLDWEDPAKSDCVERLANFQAFYMPDGDYGAIPKDEVTPVNTFRVIFNSRFGARYPLLRNDSFFSTWSQPYRFIDVTSELRSAGKTSSMGGNGQAIRQQTQVSAPLPSR